MADEQSMQDDLDDNGNGQRGCQEEADPPRAGHSHLIPRRLATNTTSHTLLLLAQEIRVTDFGMQCTSSYTSYLLLPEPHAHIREARCVFVYRGRPHDGDGLEQSRGQSRA